jgi:hypothetical protein
MLHPLRQSAAVKSKELNHKDFKPQRSQKIQRGELETISFFVFFVIIVVEKLPY